MSMFSYLFYLGSMLLYSLAFGCCLLVYGRLGRTDMKYAGLLMLTRICDSVYVLVTARLSDHTAMHPLALTAALMLSVIKICLLGRIVYTIFHKEMPSEFLILPCVVVIFHGLLSTFPQNLYWNLQPLTFNVSILIICGIFWSLWVQETDPERRQFVSRYVYLILAMLGFSFLAMLYLVTSLSLMKTPLALNRMDLYANCFYLFLALWYLRLCWEELEESKQIQEPSDLASCLEELDSLQAPESAPQEPPEALAAFCRQYELTEREAEILRLILSGKNNQEISEMLYITVGTVKSHVHSVFGKLEVSRRSQLIAKYLAYSSASLLAAK